MKDKEGKQQNTNLPVHPSPPPPLIEEKPFLLNGIGANNKDLHDKVNEIDPSYMRNFENYNIWQFLKDKGYKVEHNPNYK